MNKRLISASELGEYYTPVTEGDGVELQWHIECDIPLFIDEQNQVYNEAGTYIADVIEN